MGAPLPKASLGATDKTISFRGYCFGQASSHAGFIYYSGGSTLAVNNTYKTRENGPLNKYEYVSFTKVMRLDPNTEEWAQVRTTRPLPWVVNKCFPPTLSQVFMVRPDVKQDYTLYGAVPATVSLKRIKVTKDTLGPSLKQEERKGWPMCQVKSGRLACCQIAQEDAPDFLWFAAQWLGQQQILELPFYWGRRSQHMFEVLIE